MGLPSSAHICFPAKIQLLGVICRWRLPGGLSSALHTLVPSLWAQLPAHQDCVVLSVSSRSPHWGTASGKCQRGGWVQGDKRWINQFSLSKSSVFCTIPSSWVFSCHAQGNSHCWLLVGGSGSRGHQGPPCLCACFPGLHLQGRQAWIVWDGSIHTVTTGEHNRSGLFPLSSQLLSLYQHPTDQPLYQPHSHCCASRSYWGKSPSTYPTQSGDLFHVEVLTRLSSDHHLSTESHAFNREASLRWLRAVGPQGRRARYRPHEQVAPPAQPCCGAGRCSQSTPGLNHQGYLFGLYITFYVILQMFIDYRLLKVFSLTIHGFTSWKNRRKSHFHIC